MWSHPDGWKRRVLTLPGVDPLARSQDIRSFRWTGPLVEILERCEPVPPLWEIQIQQERRKGEEKTRREACELYAFLPIHTDTVLER